MHLNAALIHDVNAQSTSLFVDDDPFDWKLDSTLALYFLLLPMFAFVTKCVWSGLTNLIYMPVEF